MTKGETVIQLTKLLFGILFMYVALRIMFAVEAVSGYFGPFT